MRLSSGIGAVLAGTTGAAAVLGLWMKLRKRVTPAERERRRREAVFTAGRACDGNIVDVREGMIDYTYEIAGVEYFTSQDVTALTHLIPRKMEVEIGPAAVKYLASEPANSIVICEMWSGLRYRYAAPAPEPPPEAASAPGPEAAINQ